MKKSVISAAALLMAIAASGKEPHLRLDSAYIDMGIITGDTIAVGEMGFRNTGDEPLVILRIFTECGCTVPEFPAKPVEPGDSGVIKVRFNGRNRSDGFFRKSLRVLTNADNPRETLTIKGLIRSKH